MHAQPTRFMPGHAGLNVSNLERSKRFYQDLFGFTDLGGSTAPGRVFAFLGDNGKVVLTLWQQSDGRFDTGRPGLHHLAFQVDSMAHVEAAHRRARELGAAIHHDGLVSHGEGMASGGFYLEDPDGIRLEITTADGAEQLPAPYGSAPTCGFF